MRIAFFEDRPALEVGPIAELRPVFELVCGHFSLRERAIRCLSVSEWGAFIRDHLRQSYQELHSEAHVNDLDWLSQGTTLFLNGAWIAPAAALAQIDPSAVGLVDGAIAYVTVDAAEARLFESEPWESAIYQIARTRQRVSAPGKLFSYPWQLVAHNPQQIINDFASRPSPKGWLINNPQVALIGPADQIAIDGAARIDPFVVFDTTRGPISIDAGAIIQSFTRVEGPCHVGIGAQLFRAHIRAGTTIGPGCRVGGEVEASILHGYVNKYHEGFLGHSYLCPWVNLGALSTSSDLKNDYSTVRVPLAGKMVDTEMVKVGCFIGDHTKTGLGSLFNTGSSIGIMCMILPGGELLPRHVPSFTAVWHGELADRMPLERSLTAARVAMQRRGIELTDFQERLLRRVHAATQAERDEAILLFQEKRNRSVASAQ